MAKKSLLLMGALVIALVGALLIGSSSGQAADEQKAMSFSGSGTDEFFNGKTFCDVCVPDFLVDGVGVLALTFKVNIDADVTGNGTLKLTPPDGPIQQGNVIPITMQFTGSDGNVKLTARVDAGFSVQKDAPADANGNATGQGTEIIGASIHPSFTIFDQTFPTLHNGQSATRTHQLTSPELIDFCELAGFSVDTVIFGEFGLECALKLGFDTTVVATGNGITAQSGVQVKGENTSIPGQLIDFPKGQFTDKFEVPCTAPAGAYVDYTLSNKRYGVVLDATGKPKLVVDFSIDLFGFDLLDLLGINSQPRINIFDLFGIQPIGVFQGKVVGDGPLDNSRTLGVIEKDKQQPVIKSAVVSTVDPLEGKPVVFTATANDNCNSGADLSYVWNFSDGGTAYGASVVHVFADSGIYSANVTVTDKAGNTDTRDVGPINVAEGRGTNIKYEGPISMGPQTDDEVELSAVLVDQTGDPIKGRELRFLITDQLGNPVVPAVGNVTDVNGRARVSMRPGLEPGSYIVVVVFGGDATYDPSQFQKKFTVFSNQPPVVSPLADPGKHVWGVPIEFSGFATDPDGGAQDTLKYVWDFGDGTSAINPKVSHAYDKPGEYDVVLTVTDKDGAFSEVRTVVLINKRDTAIKNCGDIQVPNGQRTVNDCARLIDSEGDRVVGRTIVFEMTIAGTPITNSGTTDANGELRTAFNRNMPAGCFSAEIDFDGSADNLYNTSAYDYFFYTSGNGGPQNCSFTAASSSGYDVNCDGSANSVDALYILQVVAGLSSFVSCENVANVNGDGVIDPLDALTLLQYSAGV